MPNPTLLESDKFTDNFSFIAPSFGLRQQSVGVTGRLFCGDKPSSNVLVKLFDKDTGLDPDDQLDSTRTDAMGNFKVQGDERETTNIDPELKIYHHCNKGLNPCPRKWIITIPDKYIHSGRAPPKKYFDLGNVNLEVEVEGETFDCIH
uniref:Transthyretin-like family protein n=1 Tax=Globodera pallida TaxID=36090 RepID=A0A183C755_GLOPA